MLSRLAFLAFALSTALVLAAPANQTPEPIDDDVQPWFNFPFANFFAPLWKLFPMSDIGPIFESDDKQFKIAINVKDYSKKDLKVKLKGPLVIIQGIHEKTDDSDVWQSQFTHTYSLPENATSSKLTADYTTDSYLVISAPLDGEEKSSNFDRIVPITETGKPYQPSEASSTTAAFEDDRKEETTPASEREDLLRDSANSIPHGNEALQV